MSQLLSRRAFAVGLAFSLPASVAGVAAALQMGSSARDPAGTGLDLESVFLRVSPYHLRDRLLSTPFNGMVSGQRFDPLRWEDVSQTPYFTSVGGVPLLRAGGRDDEVLGAYSVYHAPAGARAGQFLGRRALRHQTTETLMADVRGYPAEVLVYDDGTPHELTHLPVGNVMVLGFDRMQGDGDSDHPSLENAELLLNHLHAVFGVIL